MANTHAFFSGVTIDGAADWTAQFLVNDAPKTATEAGKTLISAEVGWPSAAISGGSLTLNGSIASLDNTQKFIEYVGVSFDGLNLALTTSTAPSCVPRTRTSLTKTRRVLATFTLSSSMRSTSGCFYSTSHIPDPL